MDGEGIDLAVFTVGLFRLHHKAATSKLTQHTGLAAFGIQHQDLRLMSDVHSLKPAPFLRVLRILRVLHFLCHSILSPNALTGSISTGTSFTFARADFNSEGMESYFLNHCSARFLSPVASCSSSSLAKLAMAVCIFVKSIAYLLVLGS